MKIWYESEDGKFFDNKLDCEVHELKLIHTHLDKISFYSKENNKYIEYHIDYNQDITSDDYYQKCEKINIHNEDEFQDLMWLSKYCGWIEFEQFTQPGIWIRHEDNHKIINGVWRRE